MYPAVVIVLVETQRSMMDVCEMSPSTESKFAGPGASEGRAATFGHLSFAVGSMNSTIENESEFQRSRVLQNQDRQEYGSEKDILDVKEGSLG